MRKLDIENLLKFNHYRFIYEVAFVNIMLLTVASLIFMLWTKWILGNPWNSHIHRRVLATILLLSVIYLNAYMCISLAIAMTRSEIGLPVTDLLPRVLTEAALIGVFLFVIIEFLFLLATLKCIGIYRIRHAY